jgi:hypothetical protein
MYLLLYNTCPCTLLSISHRRLHCPRNTVHINLFLSFMFRATVSILKDNILVQGLGLPGDVYHTQHDDRVVFLDGGSVSTVSARRLSSASTAFVFYYIGNCTSYRRARF